MQMTHTEGNDVKGHSGKTAVHRPRRGAWSRPSPDLGSGLQNRAAISVLFNRLVCSTESQGLQQTNTGDGTHFEERQSKVRGQRATGDGDNTEGHQREPMLTPRVPNRPGCSLHQDQPSRGFLGGQNSPKRPQAYTCAYTWLSAFYVQVKQQLLLLKRISLLPMSLFFFLLIRPPHTLSILLPRKK